MARKTRTYKSWESMRQRCLNPSAPNYPRYGGRGITICDRWSSFVNFLADMGERPEGVTLDRINVDGDYGPDNCCWSTPAAQAQNRRDNRLLTLAGVTKCLAEWARDRGVPEYLIRHRIDRGWSDERTLLTPMRVYTRKAGM